MFEFYHNVETEDGERSDGCSAGEVMVVARQMYAEEGGKAILLETILEKDGEIYYQNNRPVSERILLIPAGQ